MTVWRRLALVVLVAAAVAVPAALAQEAASPTAGEWLAYAGNVASQKYSPLDQINRDNVDRLEVVWRAVSVDYGIATAHDGLAATNLFETSPMMRDGRLLLATGLAAAAALDPASGEILWLYDLLADGAEPDLPSLGFRVYRGGASWSGGDERRLVYTGNGYLVALDAVTGKPAAGFGDGGRVDVRPRSGERVRPFFWTSPPVVCRDTIVIGNSTTDIAMRQRAPKGTIRGYDVRSGEALWTFDIIPEAGAPGSETWLDGAAERTGHANVWSWMSCDEELGLVYAPTTTPNNDWYGGHRPGDGLYAESIVALEARSGRLAWHFQAVHHGLWDYDFPAGPILADIEVDGRPIKALAQVSKQAFVYVLDRTNGEPVWPIVEMPVPASTVPGERASPTQPIPTWPKAYDLQGLRPDDLIDFTPELRAEAMEVLSKYQMGPLFLPPRVKDQDGLIGFIEVPSAVGGTNWNGAAYDPETHVLYVPSVTVVMAAYLDRPTGRGTDIDWVLDIRKDYPRLELEGGLPLTRPPYGRLTAIDLDTGEHLWVAPNGDGPRDHPRLKHLDLPPLGQPGRASPLVTKTLVFLAEGSPDMVGVPDWAGGNGFRAFDKQTGEELWKIDLPLPASGAPMTYLHEDRQFLVVPVGDREHPGELVALALPR